MDKEKSLQDFEWVNRCIMSCRNTFQIESAEKLIDAFAAKYKDATLIEELQITHRMCWDDIHTVLN